MSFQPQVQQELLIDGVSYRVAEHPNAPNMPFGQEGRQAIVYRLVNGDGSRALKVFKPRFSTPSLVSLADQIAPLASLPGLQVCQRTVLTVRRHTALLRQFPDLTYAVLMPWVDGPTWQEVLLEKRPLTPEQSLRVARALAEVLVTMEERGLAHCDLSAPNLILAPDLVQAIASLVDVEGLYAPGLPLPKVLPAGSPGYAHCTAPQGLWSPEADRFAGAVLLAEILGWSQAEIRQAAWGENYFHAREMQGESQRYQTLVASLRSNWGDRLSNLFTSAWHSDTLADCPTLGKWLVALPERVPQPPAAVTEPDTSPADPAQATRLVMQAEQAAGQGELDKALALYRQALTQATPELAQDFQTRMQVLERQAQGGSWNYSNCGQIVPTAQDRCPHCERGQKPGSAPQKEEREPAPATQTPTRPPAPAPAWRCSHCDAMVPAGMQVCPHCERGRDELPAAQPSTKGGVPIPVWVWLAGGLVLVIVLVGLVGAGLLWLKPTATPTATATPSSSATRTSTRSATPTQTDTPTLTPGRTPTESPTIHPTVTASATPDLPALGSTQVRQKDNMVMVYVPAGEFPMGSTEGNSDEQPVHTVELDAFWLDRTEVTNTQYQLCVAAGECEAPTVCDWGEPTYDDATKADHPVVCVDWYRAAAYCEWAGGRLPTEAEWEYAARGPEANIYPWGDDFDCSYGNFDDETEYDDYVVEGGAGCDGYVEAAPVGSFPRGASWVGAQDMAGNVWEWVSDWYDSSYYGDAPYQNPTGPESGSTRVLRGGSWYYDEMDLRSTNRSDYLFPDHCDYYVGFRCVVSAPGE